MTNNNIKTKNIGERGEDLISLEFGAQQIKNKGAADHVFNNRYISDKTFAKASPTILNARRILCEIKPPLSISQLQTIRGIKTAEYKNDRIKKIKDMGSSLIFKKYDNVKFETALSQINKNLPQHLAQSIIDW